jgi:hypothetical protein
MTLGQSGEAVASESVCGFDGRRAGILRHRQAKRGPGGPPVAPRGEQPWALLIDEQRRPLARVHVLARPVGVCPGQKPPVWAAKRPVHPYKNAIQ